MYDISSSHIIMLDAFWKNHKEGKTDRWMAYACFWFCRQQVFNGYEYWLNMGAYLVSQLSPEDRESLTDQCSGTELKILMNPPTEAPEMPQALLQQFQSLFEPVPPAFDLEKAQAEAVDKVNREAAAQRAQYLTTGVGMTLVYSKKLEEARAKLANPSIANDKIQHIVDEAAINGVSVTEAAQNIVDTEAAWSALSAPIEKRRMTIKKAISEATTAEEIAAAFMAPVE